MSGQLQAHLRTLLAQARSDAELEQAVLAAFARYVDRVAEARADLFDTFGHVLLPTAPSEAERLAAAEATEAARWNQVRHPSEPLQ